MSGESLETVGPLLVSREQAAAVVGVGLTLFTRLADTGRLGPLPVRLGRRSLYRLEELKEWVNAGCPSRREWLRMQENKNER